jgi:hypothetical protein
VQVGLDQARFEQTRQLVELLVDRVVVTDGEVEIRYVIPTTPASEHVRFCHLRTDYFDERPFAEEQSIQDLYEPVAHILAQFRDAATSLENEKTLSQGLRAIPLVGEELSKEARTRRGRDEEPAGGHPRSRASDRRRAPPTVVDDEMEPEAMKPAHRRLS